VHPTALNLNSIVLEHYIALDLSEIFAAKAAEAHIRSFTEPKHPRKLHWYMNRRARSAALEGFVWRFCEIQANNAVGPG
jgi:hypothetical protein